MLPRKQVKERVKKCYQPNLEITLVLLVYVSTSSYQDMIKEKAIKSNTTHRNCKKNVSNDF